MNPSVHTDLSLDDIKNCGIFVPSIAPMFSAFSLTGKDATRYLHGRLTQDIAGLALGQGARSLLLLPNGRVQGVCTALKTDEGYLILADTTSTEAREQFVADLFQFKVSDDAQCTTIDEFAVILLGVRSSPAFPPLPAPETARAITYARVSLGGLSAQLISDSTTIVPFNIVMVESPAQDRLCSELESLGLRQGNFQLLEVIRILGGTPRMGIDITERTLAADLPLEKYVSFTKGCYVGQEVVEMATARGRPNRRWAKLTCSRSVEIPIGTEIKLQHRTEERSAGTVSSSCVIRGEDMTVCLAFLPASLDFPAKVLIAGETFFETDAGSPP